MNSKSKLILGTVQFGMNYGINNTHGFMEQTEIDEILKLAQNNGIHTLDTAAAYGSSESRIGDYLNRDSSARLHIITKFSLKDGLNLKESLAQSLKRLKVSCVDTIMFHSWEDYAAVNQVELMEFLSLKGSLYKKLGISIYTNEQMDSLLETDLFDLVQAPFNALDNRNIRGAYFRQLKEKGMEIHARSVFLQGLFFMQLNTLPAKLSPLAKYLSELKNISSKYQIDYTAMLLHYALTQKDIDGVLIGIDSLEQITSNIESLERNVPIEALREIDQIKVIETTLLNPSTWNN